MLNKDLLRYRIKNRKIIPSFIDVSSTELISLASDLLRLYDIKAKPAKSEIEENLNHILNSIRDLKLSKGLNKIILDNSEFISLTDENISQERAALFEYSSKEIKNKGSKLSYIEYKENIFSKFSFFPNNSSIYIDLPENDILHSIKSDITPITLLNRYNCSLIQSILLHSQKISLKISNPKPKEMRGFFRYLKFFRLLASINKKGKTKDYHIEIDGPLNILENSKKYGLQLASFFPVICFLNDWKLSAEINLKNGVYNLSVSNEDKIKSHYRRPSSYIPEEFSLYEKLFNKKSKDWKIIESKYFINPGNQQIIFPDFTFKNTKTNRTAHLELFHRWHYTQLINRLSSLKNVDENPFFIGIDRSIYKKKEIKMLIDSSPSITDKFFLFSDFPGVNNTLEMIGRF